MLNKITSYPSATTIIGSTTFNLKFGQNSKQFLRNVQCNQNIFALNDTVVLSPVEGESLKKCLLKCSISKLIKKRVHCCLYSLQRAYPLPKPSLFLLFQPPPASLLGGGGKHKEINKTQIFGLLRQGNSIYSQERIPPQVLSHVIRFTQYRYLYFFYISLEYENK